MIKWNSEMQNQYKNKGISLLIAMGGSFLVLLIAFAILISIQKMLSQMDSLERSTKLFFAAESGAEAAFYHHNARGGGVAFKTLATIVDNSSQTIAHLSDSIETKWTIRGRSDVLDVGEYPIIGLLKEGQSVQIPLSWDAAEEPKTSPTPDLIGGTGGSNEDFWVEFYNSSDDMKDLEKAAFEAAFGDSVTIPAGFDFGKDNTDGYEILIDWSLSRKNTAEGIQTFSPLENDCSDEEDFICEDRVFGGGIDTPSEILSSGSADTKIGGPRMGRVLPGYATIPVELGTFLDCLDAATNGGQCEEYVLTFRPLLRFESSIEGEDKIPGIPYIIEAGNGGATNFEIPKQSYTVDSVVSEGDFSQRITIEVPEKTSIGAFDYVIFD